VGVLLASWKRVGRRVVVGVEVPEALGKRRLERLDRIPERMATPMVPQPRTVRVSDSGFGSIFYLVIVLLWCWWDWSAGLRWGGGGMAFLSITVVRWLPRKGRERKKADYRSNTVQFSAFIVRLVILWILGRGRHECAWVATPAAKILTLQCGAVKAWLVGVHHTQCAQDITRDFKALGLSRPVP